MLKVIQTEGNEHVACLSCTAEYHSFKELFADVVEDMNWPADSWERWLAWNEDYEGDR